MFNGSGSNDGRLKNERIFSAAAKFLPEMINKKKNQTDAGLSSHRIEIFHTDFGSSIRSRKGLGSMNLLNEPRRRDSVHKPVMQGELCLDMGCTNIGTEYTERTTLHGLRYVGDSDLHLIERLFWTVAFVFGVLGAAYFITSLYNRWSDSPMIVSLSPTPTLLETIPFPAITICNMNGARKTIAEGILAKNDTSDRSRFEKEMLDDVCGKKFENAKTRVSANWTTVHKFLIKVSQSCHDMLIACKWRSIQIPCMEIFNPELTDEGMCCSFNKVKRSFIFRNPKQTLGLMNYTFPYPGIDWTPESGYPTGTPVETNPWRAWGPGRSMGLTLVLDVQVDEYFCSSTASVGFKTMLHNPVEAPRISDLAYFITPGVEARVEIVPKITKSSPNLANIPLEKRLCLFSAERELRFYRTYTQRNCQLECHSNFTLQECNCVPFYLPKDQDTRICGTSDDTCVENAKAAMEEQQLSRLVNTSMDNPDVMECSCLPSCVTIEYNKQMSASKLEDSFSIRSDYLSDRDPAYYKENMAVVHFFFTENSFTGVEKGEIFGFTEFISNTGGLLGLFLGFSIMSAVEMLYFLSLRLLCSWRRSKKPIIQPTSKSHIFPFTQ